MKSPVSLVMVILNAVLLLMCNCLFLSPGFSQEQEDEYEAASEIQVSSVSGVVVSVDYNLGLLVVRQLEEGAGVFNIYVVKRTTFEVVDSLRNISAGDKLSIDYFVYKGQMIADNIIRQEKFIAP